MVESFVFKKCLTKETGERLEIIFPEGQVVRTADQRRLAELIRENPGSALGDQVVEFLVLNRGVPMRNIIGELKELSDPARRLALCRWRLAERRKEHNGQQLVAAS